MEIILPILLLPALLLAPVGVRSFREWRLIRAARRWTAIEQGL